MFRRLILAAAVAALLLSGCGGAVTEVILPCDRLASALAAAQGFPEDSGAVYAGSPEYDRYLEQYYLLSPDWTEDGAVILAGGVQAGEIAAFRLSQAANAEKAAQALEAYRQRRAVDFAGYAPEQERMHHGSGHCQSGPGGARLEYGPSGRGLVLRGRDLGRSQRSATQPEPSPVFQRDQRVHAPDPPLLGGVPGPGGHR